MPNFKLWEQSSNDTHDAYAATPDEALAKFSQMLGKQFSFEGPDIVPNFLFQGPMPEEAHWVDVPDIPVFEVRAKE